MTIDIPSDKKTSLQTLLNKHREILLQESEFSDLSKHQGEKGRHNEGHLKRFLQSQLPGSMAIHTGFIQCSNEKYGQSSQQDIIIYDTHYNAPLYLSEDWGIFPIEMVHGIIEVKTTLTNKLLKEAIGKNRLIRDMAEGHGKYYVYHTSVESKEVPGAMNAGRKRFVHKTPPRFFIFTYKVDKKDFKNTDSLVRKLAAACVEYGGHCHGLYVLEEDSFISQHSNTRIPTFTYFDQDGWLLFLDQLKFTLRSIETPPADLEKYRNPISGFIYEHKNS